MTDNLLRHQILAWIVLLGSSPVSAAVIELQTNDEPKRDVGIVFEFLEDPNNVLTFEDLNQDGSTLAVDGTTLEWFRSENSTPNFGYSSSTFWGRLTLMRDARAPEADLILENSWPHVDRIELRVMAPGLKELSREVGGLLSPQAGRSQSHRNPAFGFRVPAGTQVTLYLKIDSVNALQFPLVLWQRDAFLDNDHNEQFVFGIFYGILLVMVLYNLFIYLGIREQSYLDYVLFIAALTLLQADINKYTYEYIWPDAPDWTIHSIPMLVSLTVVVAMRFITGFLGSESRHPTGHKILIAVRYLSIPGIVIPLVAPHRFAAVYCLGLAGVAIVTAMVSTVRIARAGYAPAKYFMMAWGAFLLGALTIILRNFQVLPAVFITAYGLQIGIALGVLLLSFSLAARIREIKKEKERAEAASIEAQMAALRKSEEAARVKSEFLANMSHELRTPLNALCNIPRALMTNFSEQHVWECPDCHSYFEDDAISRNRLERQPCPECPNSQMKIVPIIQYQGDQNEQHHFIKRLDVQAHELLGLVERVLSFNDAHSGHKALHLERIDSDNFLGGTLDRYQTKCAERSQQLDISVDIKGPDIHVDIDKIEQTVDLVLDNALKFSMNGGRIACEIFSNNDGHLIVAISDDGIGIPGSEIEKIFTPFYQVESSHTREFGGAGLGLALAKELVELHHGHIEVESVPGAGSTFRLHFRNAKH